MNTLQSEQVILSAPMSFDGATRRIWRWYHPRVLASQGWPGTGRWALLWTLLVLAWIGVLTWYAALTATFGIGIIILIVFRLVRRSQRRGQRDQLRHAELLRQLPPATR